MYQIKFIHKSLLTSGSFVVDRISYLAEDMMDTENNEVVSKGKELTAFLKDKKNA